MKKTDEQLALELDALLTDHLRGLTPPPVSADLN